MLFFSTVDCHTAVSSTTLCYLKVICFFGCCSREFFACKSALSHARVEEKSWHNFSAFVLLYQRRKTWRAPETDTVLQMVVKQWGILLAIQKGNATKHPLRQIRSPHGKGSHTIKRSLKCSKEFQSKHHSLCTWVEAFKISLTSWTGSICNSHLVVSLVFTFLDSELKFL